MNAVDIRIMASPKREAMARALAQSVGYNSSIITFDDRRDGGDAMYTARKTWLAIDRNKSHGIVLQDDAEVVNNFEQHAVECSKSFPNAIFSFYCARTKLKDLTLRTPYVKLIGDHCVAGGVAIMMPTYMIQHCFDWIAENLGEEYAHDDAAIGMFAQANQIDVFTTIPSLVQHLAPTKSLVGLNNYQKISKVWIGKDIEFVNFKTCEFSIMHMNFPWCTDNTVKGSKAETYMQRLKMNSKRRRYFGKTEKGN